MDLAPLRNAAAGIAAEQQHLVDRILTELDFAREFNDQLAQRKSWPKLIDQAAAVVEKALLSQKPTALPGAIHKAEDLLAPIGKQAKQYTAHCLGHAHIDMNWMWSWPETVATTHDSFTTVLALMDEFEDFCFAQSQASVYEIVRQHAPEQFERIRQLVAEGRWEVTAPQWVEGDKNLPTGESLVRHLLYTRRYFAEHFDLAPEDVPLDWEPDTFGHAHTIPSILSRAGVSRYYFCRGGADKSPPLFWWRGPDGSRVLGHREFTWYNDQVKTHNWRGLVSFCKATGLKDWLLVYGVGDHGGGPTRRDMRMIHEMNDWPIFPTFRMNTSRDYFRIVEAHGENLPVLDRELNTEFPGCYTTQTSIKTYNRLGEHLLPAAEAASLLAWRTINGEYPTATFRENWIPVLFGHFHDILPGSGVRETREYHSGKFQDLAATVGLIRTRALRALAAEIDTSYAGLPEATDSPARTNVAFGGGQGRGSNVGGASAAGHQDDVRRAFVVFNPTTTPRQEVVRVSLWEAEHDAVLGKHYKAVFPDGRETPAQFLDQGVYWGHQYIDLAVPITVEPLGYAGFVVTETDQTTEPAWQSGYRIGRVMNVENPAENLARHMEMPGFTTAGQNAMQNKTIRAEFDPATGGLIALIDRKTGLNLIAPGDQAGLEYLIERPGEMSAWKLHPTLTRQFPLGAHRFEPIQFGPHVATFETDYRIGDSAVTLIWELHSSESRLRLSIRTNWLERGSESAGIPGLRLRVPLALDEPTAIHESPLGWIQRNDRTGEELPTQRFIQIAGTPAGRKTQAACVLLNDCKYGCSLTENVLRMTLIRSSYMPDPLPEMGAYEMAFALQPLASPAAPAGLIADGAAFNQPLQVLGANIHKGRLPAASGPILTAEPAGVLATAIKKAEDDDAIIVRLLETAGKTANARVQIDAEMIGRVASAEEVDLLERPVDPSTAKPTETGFSVKLAPRAITSVKVKLS